MKKTTPELTEHEEIVKRTVNNVLKPYSGRYSIESGESSHGGWEVEIVPKNPKAAKIYISDIDSHIIYMAVDDMFFVEFYPEKNDYQDGLQDLKAHIIAAVGGKIKGYHIRHKTDFTKQAYMKTVIEFELEDTITPWSRNVIFRNHFKKRKDIIERQYEPY